MSRSLKKLELAAALLVMPLQGIAATLSVLLCHGDPQMHAVQSNGGKDRGVHHGGQQDESGMTGNSAYHPCCNYTVSPPAAVTLTAAPRDFPVRAFAPDSLHDLFVPDRPQRPPLA